jgi:hypothetical protein
MAIIPHGFVSQERTRATIILCPHRPIFGDGALRHEYAILLLKIFGDLEIKRLTRIAERGLPDSFITSPLARERIPSPSSS